MKAYLKILDKIVSRGITKKNRTGIDTISITGHMFEHNMEDGFPLLTTKKMGMKNIATELEFFIKGLSNKKWLQERGCHIWDSWCNPEKIPYGHDDETKKRMKEEMDLGRIYGVQWRNWRKIIINEDSKSINIIHKDQLQSVIDKLKTDPFDRRMIVSAWNPVELDKMALPPCHYSFQVLSDGKKIDLLWNQRSCDVPLGIPYNIASYGLLLKLIADTVGMMPGKLIGFLSDVHIYKNQLDGVYTQLKRQPRELPILEFNDSFTNLFEWKCDEFTLLGYDPCERIKFSDAAV